MPDIKTALESALQNAKEVTASTKALTATITKWAEDDKPLNQTNLKEKKMSNANPVINYAKLPDGKVRFTETVGVARAVFDYVQANSGAKRSKVIDALLAKGFKKSSVGSLITQNLRAGHFVQDSESRIHCALKDYNPVPTTKKRLMLKQKAERLKKLVDAPAKTITLVPVKPKAQPKAQPKADAGIAALKVDTGVLGVPVFDPKELLNTLSVMQARALYDELKKVFGG